MLKNLLTKCVKNLLMQIYKELMGKELIGKELIGKELIGKELID